MKFLADAHVSAELVAMIRAFGNDCSDASAIPPRMKDVDILRMATAGQRVVVTIDKDFGELVFNLGIPAVGVVLIRLSSSDEPERVERLRDVWPIVMSRLPGTFVTVTDSRVRGRPLA